METTTKYDKSKPLRDKILYVLSVMEKATPHEISTEDGVEDISIDIENELEKLCDEGAVIKLREHRQQRRYVLNRK